MRRSRWIRHLITSLAALALAGPVHAAPPSAVRAKDRRVPIGWTLIGAGAVALATGVAFLALHDRPYRARCSGADIDSDGNCRQLYDTRIHGAALTGGGGVLVISGAAMLLMAHFRRGDGSGRERARLRRALLEGRF